MSKKTQFTGSKNKIRSLSWTSPIYQHVTKGTNLYVHSYKKKSL